MRVPSPTLAASALAILALLSAGCGGGSTATNGTNAEATATASTPPEEALRLYVERTVQQGFVANCDDARQPDDDGKYCARFRGERNGLLAYELGPTFGASTILIILQNSGGAWTVAHSERRDPSQPEVPGIPWPLEVGAEVVVEGTGDCLRVRSQPGLSSQQVDCIDDGERVRLVAGPVEADDLEWWQLEGHGWAAGAWLRYPDAAEATPTP